MVFKNELNVSQSFLPHKIAGSTRWWVTCDTNWCAWWLLGLEVRADLFWCAGINHSWHLRIGQELNTRTLGQTARSIAFLQIVSPPALTHVAARCPARPTRTDQLSLWFRDWSPVWQTNLILRWTKTSKIIKDPAAISNIYTYLRTL